MEHAVSPRRQLLLTALALAAVAALAIAAGKSDARAQQLEAAERVQSEGHLGELASSLDALAQTLSVARYADGDALLRQLASRAVAESAVAKAELAAVTSAGTTPETVARFLSQAGQYAFELAERRTQGETLTEDDRATLSALADYARSLADAVARLEQRVFDGETSLDAPRAYPDASDGAFAEAESLASTGALVYGGADSDRTEKAADAEPPAVTEDQAQTIAETFAGQALPTAAQHSGEVEGWVFSDDTAAVFVAERGGQIAAAMIREPAAAPTLDAAEETARTLLAQAGFSQAVEISARKVDSEWIATFVPEQDGVLCLADAISVGVSDDRIWFDAREYCRNHREREITPPAVSEDDGLAALGAAVRDAQFCRRVLLPTDSGEVDCYAYRATGGDGDALMIYVDTATGEEVKIELR